MVRIVYEAKRFIRGVRFRLTRRLPTHDAADVFPGIDRVEIAHQPLVGRSANLKPHELALLCAAVRWSKSRALFEFGTFDGRTAWHLARNAGPGAKVWTLDLPMDHPARFAPGHDRRVGRVNGIPVGEKFAETPESGRITQLYCDSLEFDPMPFEGTIDFCFIDGGHGYEHVHSDTANALRMIKPGGLIFWHDYSRWWPGVQRCLDECAATLPVFRVEGTALAALQT
jgi:predicted O-methyltransferase YrrM